MPTLESYKRQLNVTHIQNFHKTIIIYMTKAKYVPRAKLLQDIRVDPPDIRNPKTRIIQKNLVYLIGLP